MVGTNMCCQGRPAAERNVIKMRNCLYSKGVINPTIKTWQPWCVRWPSLPYSCPDVEVCFFFFYLPLCTEVSPSTTSSTSAYLGLSGLPQRPLKEHPPSISLRHVPISSSRHYPKVATVYALEKSKKMFQILKLGHVIHATCYICRIIGERDNRLIFLFHFKKFTEPGKKAFPQTQA